MNVHGISSHSFFVPWPQKRPIVNVYYKNKNVRIILMYEICENLKIFHKLRPTDQIICAIPWSIEDDFMLTNHSRFVDIWDLKPSQFCFLAAEEKQIPMIERFGFKAIYCNQNCFLDEQIFKPRECKKEYDAVLNAKLVEYKRPHLANKVNDLLLLSGLSPREVNPPKHKVMIEKFLSPHDVCVYINQARTGLMLSKEEGANWAIGELLLSGIPIISSKSVGGRDVWFDSYNSIICEDNEESVADSVKQMIERNPSPQQIRNNFIQLAQTFRRNFIEYTHKIFNENGSNIDASGYFSRKFRHKMVAIPNDYEMICKELSFF